MSRTPKVKKVPREDLVEIQAPDNLALQRHGATEVARLISQHSGWRFGPGDALYEADGALIALTIGDASAAMDELAWIDPSGHVRWKWMPDSPTERAAVLREALDHNGMHSLWSLAPRPEASRLEDLPPFWAAQPR